MNTPNTPMEKELAIVFADIVASSSLTANLGDLHTTSLIQHFFDRGRRFAQDHNAQITKFTGDGLLAIFDQTADAVEFAIEFQRSLRDDPIPAGGGNLQAKIAVHSDRAELRDTEYGSEVFGAAVNVAARLQSLCAPGSVILSDRAYRQLPRSSATRFSDRQQVRLKGVRDEATVWSLSPTSEDVN